jgi:hypothetical protein
MSNSKQVFWVYSVVVKLVNRVYGCVFRTLKNNIGFPKV